MQPRPGTFAQFTAGVGLFARGIGTYARNPRLMLLGLLPAVIACVLLLTGYTLLIAFINDAARTVTWFAADWPSAERDAIRVLAAIALLGVGALLAIVVFTGLTLAIGDPFYEKISERVEQEAGGLPDAVSRPWYREMGRGLVESMRLMIFSALVGAALFVAGLLPAVGQTVVPVVGALVGGWALALELTAIPFARRGYGLRERRALLRRYRPMALGFGVSVFLCFLIPLGAVVLMPAAVAGATLLARRVQPAAPQPVVSRVRDRPHPGIG